MLSQAYAINKERNKKAKDTIKRQQISSPINNRYRYNIKGQLISPNFAQVPLPPPSRKSPVTKSSPGPPKKIVSRPLSIPKTNKYQYNINGKLINTSNRLAITNHNTKKTKTSTKPSSKKSNRSVISNKNDSKLVSVIIVTENSRKYIYNSVFTILKQGYQNLELIIVDNHSEDGTLEFLKNLNDNRIKIISLKENTSIANCRNLGMQLSKGNFITFQEPNYISISDRLSKQLRLTSDSSISVVGEQITELDGIKYNYNNFMMNRSTFKKFGFFQDQEKHIIEYVKRVSNHDVKVNLVPELFYIRYDTLVNGVSDYQLDTLNDIDEISPTQRVEFENLAQVN